MDIEYIGRMLKFHRKISGLSQKRLAELSGVGKTVIFDIEKGKANVRLSTLLKVLHIMNIKIEFKSPLMNLFKEQSDEKS